MIFKIRYLVNITLLIVLTNGYLFSQIGGSSCATAVAVGVNYCSGNYTGTIPGLTAATSTTSLGLFCNGAGPLAIKAETWLKFTTESAPATIPTTISISSSDSYNAGTKNYGFELYQGPCPGTYVTCVNTTAKTETLSISLAANTTYYIRLVNLGTSTSSVTPANPINIFDVCIIQKPAGDNISGAALLPVSSGTCNYQPVPLHLSTNSTCLPNPTCGNFTPGTSQDIWYRVVVPASGNFFINTHVTTNGPAFATATQPPEADNIALAVYSSSVCASASILGCSDSSPAGLLDPNTSSPYDYPPMSMPSLYMTGATPGNTLYIRVWNETGYTLGTFDICVNNMPCGNLPNNDFCSSPAPILFAGATATSVATNTVTGINYTYDEPGDINPAADVLGCIYPSNNSWYSFVAIKNDEDNGLDIPFSSSSCSNVEAAIYEITKTINGCCANFTQLDNCSGSGSNFTLHVDPGFLLEGNTYYLMINNANLTPCTFSITGWSAPGVLPVNFISFIGENNGTENILKWIVIDDDNVESYTLESSIDAVNFTEVENIDAKKFIYSANTEYKVTDKNPRLDLTYYRVSINTESGEKKYSNTISVYLRDKYENIYNLHPNPTNADLNFEYYSQTDNRELYIQLIGATGNLILDLKQTVGEGKNNISLPMESLEKGVYILKVVSEKSGKTTHHKIIKN